MMRFFSRKPRKDAAETLRELTQRLCHERRRCKGMPMKVSGIAAACEVADKYMTLDSWLAKATSGLCNEARLRVSKEIRGHFAEAVEARTAEGETRDRAVKDSLAALGNAYEARMGFHYSYLTQGEVTYARFLRSGMWGPPAFLILLSFHLLGVYLAYFTAPTGASLTALIGSSANSPLLTLVAMPFGLGPLILRFAKHATINSTAKAVAWAQVALLGIDFANLFVAALHDFRLEEDPSSYFIQSLLMLLAMKLVNLGFLGFLFVRPIFGVARKWPTGQESISS